MKKTLGIELTEEQMNALRDAELAILIYVDKICKKNKIRYSITAGTLLGAVRHGGFIPWDDDIDIMMTRTEYNRFCKIMDEETDERYFFADAWRDESFALTFGKVMLSGTVKKEVYAPRKSSIRPSISIDIFPIDKSFDDIKRRKKQFFKARLIKLLLSSKCGYPGSTVIKTAAKRLIKIICSPLPKAFLLNRFEKNLNYTIQSKTYISLNGDGWERPIERETFPADIFDDFQEMEFEGHKFMAIKNYDLFLRIVYGDYMSPPPKELQTPPHSLIELKFREDA